VLPNAVCASPHSRHVWRTKVLLEDRSQGATTSLSKVLCEPVGTVHVGLRFALNDQVQGRFDETSNERL
jgi:hypothetical protein